MSDDVNPEEPGEVYYLDENGNKQDASIHNAILAEGDTRGELEDLRKRLLTYGFTKEEIDALLRHFPHDEGA